MNDTPTTMKAYDSNQVWVCSECGSVLTPTSPGRVIHQAWKFSHDNPAEPIKCPDIGKQFKLPMVELEEVKPA